MMPLLPSTSIYWPSLRIVAMLSIPTTHGLPYSRATRAPCWSMPPTSRTTAAALIHKGVQPGSVALVTKISPNRPLAEAFGPHFGGCPVLPHHNASLHSTSVCTGMLFYRSPRVATEPNSENFRSATNLQISVFDASKPIAGGWVGVQQCPVNSATTSPRIDRHCRDYLE